MPRGVPNNNKGADTPPPRKLTVTLHEADYVALEQLAYEQYRTPELQLAWLVAKVLSEAGRTAPQSAGHVAERILQRAKAATEANGS